MKDEKEFSAVKNSIQTRLSGVMLLVLIFALGINVFIFAQIRTAVGRIDAVFSSNTAINELSDSIEQVESTVYEYLNTNSSQALENYYRYEQNYRNLLEDLNDRNLDNEAKMLEKNIRRMSETYLDQTNETVQAKRGRNVEKYKTSYEEEHELYEYINSYSYNLNNLRFKMNSANYQLLLSAMNVLYKLCIAVMLVVYALGLVVTTLLVRNMIRPLTALSNTAHEVAKGNLNVPQLPVVVEDEVGIVTRSFNQMLESIRQNIEQLKDSMFNSLNAGAQLAMMGDADKTGAFLEKMADFFRYNVRKMEEDAMLWEEVEAVDNYIYILNVRFAGDITYIKEVDEGIENIRIPSMILQPLVENAVQHGIHDCMETGWIRMSIHQNEDMLDITISDNGAGMTEEMIAKVMSGSASQDNEDRFSTGIAVRNVIDRLQLYYKQKEFFTIESDGPDTGTTVHIMIPVEKDDTEIPKDGE